MYKIVGFKIGGAVFYTRGYGEEHFFLPNLFDGEEESTSVNSQEVEVVMGVEQFHLPSDGQELPFESFSAMTACLKAITANEVGARR